MLSKDKLEPCLLGGLLPWRLAGRLFPLLPGKLPPVKWKKIFKNELVANPHARKEPYTTCDYEVDSLLYVGVAAFLTGVRAYGDDSVSLNESGVPILRLTVLLNGMLRVVLSLIWNLRGQKKKLFFRINLGWTDTSHTLLARTLKLQRAPGTPIN